MIEPLDFIKDLQDNKIRKMYIFGGLDYGIKTEYIDMLRSHFTDVISSDSAEQVISTFRQKSLFDINHTLYIVRYDNEFLSHLNSQLVLDINRITFRGSIVLVYESEEAIKKCDKFLPNYTLTVPRMSSNMITKHLMKISNLNPSVLSMISSVSDNYAEAKIVAKNISYLDDNTINTLTYLDIMKLTGKQVSGDDDAKVTIASKNFSNMIVLLDQYDDPTLMIYSIMNTMIDLERVKTSRFIGNYKNCEGLWKLQDIYNMYMISYYMMIKLRSYYNNSYDAALFLIELCCWKTIPNSEDFK